MAAIPDIVVNIIPATPRLARQGFGTPALVGLTGQRSVLIIGTGSSGLAAKSTVRQGEVSLEILLGSGFTYAFAAGVVTIEIPAGALVRDLIADFNANAPTIVTDELTLEKVRTGSGPVALIAETLLVFIAFRTILLAEQLRFFYDTTDPEFIILGNMIAQRPTTAERKLIDVFGEPDISDAITAVDDGSWYMLHTTSTSEVVQQELSDYVSTRKRQFLPVSSDQTILETIQDRRTSWTIHDAPDDHPEASWSSSKLWTLPGSTTWKDVGPLQGQSPNLTSSLDSLIFVRDNRGNSYVESDGVATMDEGITSDPAGKTYIDDVRSQDFLEENLRIDIAQVFKDASNAGSKIPYTDEGIETAFTNPITNRLSASGPQGIIAPVEEGNVTQAEESADKRFRFSVSVPTRAEIEAATPEDIQDRIVRGITFSYIPAGAIHRAIVTGIVLFTEESF